MEKYDDFAQIICLNAVAREKRWKVGAGWGTPRKSQERWGGPSVLLCWTRLQREILRTKGIRVSSSPMDNRSKSSLG